MFKISSGMRRITAFTFIIFSPCLIITGLSMAAPVGNPADPVLLDGIYPAKVTLEVEAVWERKLTSAYENDPLFKGMFYTGKVSLYYGNRMDVYLLIGAYDGVVRNFINDNYIVVSKADVQYGGGVSYVIHQMEFARGILRLGADAKYRQFEPDIDSVKYYREKIATSHNSMTFHEWQASLGLSYQYKFIVPYVGAKYSQMTSHIHFTEESTGTVYSDKELKSKDHWGLFYGADFLMGDSVSVNIEMRQFDEKAISAGLNIRF